MNRPVRESALAYVVSLACLAASVLIRWLLDPVLGDTLPLTTLFAAVGTAVWIGGYRPAVLVVALGYLACAYLFIAPRRQFNLGELHNLVGLFLFLGTSSIIIYFGEALRNAKQYSQKKETEQREALQQIATTLESVTDGFMRYDHDWRILYVNAEAERINRLTRSEMLGKNVWEVFPALVGTKFQAEFHRAVADQVTVEFENYYEPFGRWYSLKGYPSPDGGLTTFIRDITEHKRFEQRLVESEAESERQKRLYETVLTNTPDFVYVFSLNHKVVYANEALIKMWGRGQDGAIGKTFLEIGYEPWHAAMHDREIDQVSATRKPIRGEVPFNGTNGRRLYEYIFVPVIGADGEVEAVAGTTRDITDRVLAEETKLGLMKELETQNAFMQAVLTQVPAAIVVTDAVTGQIRMSNDEAHRIVKHEYHVGKRLEDYGNTYIREAFARDGSRYASGRWPLDRALRGENVVGEEIENVMFDQSRVIVRVNAGPIRVEGKIVAAVVAFHDITARKRAEEELRASEEKYRSLFNTMDEGFCVVDVEFDSAGRATDYRIDVMNPAFEKHTGMSGLVGRSVREAIPDLEEFWYETYGRVAKTGDPIRFVHEAGPIGGRWFDVYAFRPGEAGSNKVAILFNDITARQQAEERQAFLIRLADTLRPLSDPTEVQSEASRVLGEWLGADRVVYFEVRGDDYVVERDYTKAVPSIAGLYPIASFGSDQLAIFKAGRTATDADVNKIPFLTPDEKKAYAALQIRAHVAVPLVKGGVFVAGLAVQSANVRTWTPSEIVIIEETAERTWAAVERVRAETALRQSEERLAFVRRSSGVGFWYCDLPFDVFQWDDLVKAHFHLPPDATVTVNTFFDRMHPDDREPIRQAIERSIADRTPYNVDYRTVNPDTGAIKWVRAIARTFYAADGTPIRFDGVTLEVSDQKRAEANLRESEQRFREMANAAPAMIWVTNEKHECTFLSQSWLDFTGKSNAEGIGYGWLNAVHSDDRQAAQKVFFSAAEKLESFELDYRLQTADGNYRWVIDSGKPRFNEVGDFCGFVGSVIDDHERHEFQLALNKAVKAAEAANESKSAFLANMSHEIRTPMTAILGYADLLKDLVHQDDALQHLQTIRNNGYYLLDIINDILDLSKIEAGKLDVEFERFEPHRLIEDVRSIMEVRAKEGGLTLEVQYDGMLPNVIQSDSKRLKQILINLVGNAIKFTDIGHVKIRVRFDATTRRLQFDVIDTGIGMSPEQMQRLFKPFSQGDASVSRNFGGTGLGLIISQRLAEMLGGSITAHSTEGIGSTFSVSIATGEIADQDLLDYKTMLAGTGTTPASKFNEPTKLSCHVLVVDDRRDIRFLSKHILTESGATVKECEDGLNAVENVAESLNHGSGPDLILLDMQMPNLDGYATAQRLRSLGYTGPIVALTADAMQGDMNKCLDVGCNDYLSKPIDKALLLMKVAELTQRKTP